MRSSGFLLALGCALLLGPSVRAEPNKHQVTGLFAPEREADLRAAFTQIPNIRLVRIDFANAEVTLDYDAAKLFPKLKSAEIVKRLDMLVKSASNHTFGIKPLRTTPRDKLKLTEIPVAGCNCKACCLAAYEAIYRLDGVEVATASFREGRVTALIDPAKTDRARIVAALRKREVTVVVPTK